MTVSELLKRMLAAYPSFDSKAGETWAPVFRARLAKHEGDALAGAMTEVLGGFNPTTRKPFPIPADFEAHLPSGKLNLPEEGHSIRGELKDRAERKRRNFNAWIQGQGAKIKAARSPAVYNACVLAAATLASHGDRVILTAEQIKTCEDRALSASRVAMFGPLPRTNEEWTHQIEQVRASWGVPAERAAA
jgi:hypothetical protein